MIGQAPGRNGDPSKPCTGAFALKLARVADVDPMWFMATFERMNVLQRWPGRSGKGDAFPMIEARLAAKLIAPKLKGRMVVFVGAAVARAFRVPSQFYETGAVSKKEFGFFQEISRVDYDYVVIPHPSDVSRWWNDSINRFRYREYMRGFLEEFGGSAGRRALTAGRR